LTSQRTRPALQQNEWIYDWNTATPPAIPAGTRVLME